MRKGGELRRTAPAHRIAERPNEGHSARALLAYRSIDVVSSTSDHGRWHIGAGKASKRALNGRL